MRFYLNVEKDMRLHLLFMLADSDTDETSADIMVRRGRNK